MVLFKCCTQYVSKFGKLSCGHRTEKVNFTPIAKRAMPKNILATVELYSFHMLTRLFSKSFKLGFSSSWTENIQTHKLGKGSGTRDQIVKIGWIMEKARKSQKNICFIDYSEAFDCIDHNKKKKEKKKLWKIIKETGRQEYQTTLIAFWETCIWVKKWQLDWTWKSGLMQNRERSTTRPCLVTLFI